MKQYHVQVHLLYDTYIINPFVIPHHLRYLFDRPLKVLLGMSKDATRCWIETIEEAIRTQSHQ
jgi:hypothetical protein